MSRALILSWMDTLNPMLVRCVRQELRSRAFVSAYLLLLVAGSVVSLVFAHVANQAMQDSSGDALQQGRMLFNTLAWIWAFVLIVWQSAAINRALTTERQDDTWDLVELTGLGPRRIVRGLLWTSLVQGGLYTAGLAPFLAMAYLLRGLDLLAVLEALVLVPLMGAIACAWTVMLASSQKARHLKAAGGLIGLLLLIPWGALCGAAYTGLSDQSLIGYLVDEGLTGLALGGLIVHGAALALWVPLVMSEALLSHRAEDRSSRPRLAVVVVAASVLGWVGIGALVSPSSSGDFCAGGAMLLLILAALVAFFGATEDEVLSVRQAQALASWPSPVRALLRPGDRAGLALALLLALTAQLVALPSGEGEVITGVWFTITYGGLLLLSGDALLRGPLAKLITLPAGRRLLLLLWAILWTLLPLIGLVVLPPPLAEYAGLLSPPTAVVRLADDGAWQPLVPVVASLGGVVALLLVWRAWPRRILTRAVVADATTHTPRS